MLATLTATDMPAPVMVVPNRIEVARQEGVHVLFKAVAVNRYPQLVERRADVFSARSRRALYGCWEAMRNRFAGRTCKTSSSPMYTG